jgi:hypothetical protein
MPTYVITDDTKSLCLAISGGETKNIDKDNAVVRVIPANTGLNTTAIDQLSIEHDGHFATRIPYNDVTVSGVSPSSVLDFRTKVLTILNNNSSGGGDMTAAVYDPAGYAAQVTVVDIQRTLNQAQALLASSGAAITAGQGYIIDNGGVAQLPTGISFIRVRGINLPAGAKGFDSVAEAYITALATYVPCTYDVGTNTISGQYILYAALIAQSGTAAPSVFEERINIMGEIPTFSYGGSGTYKLTVTNSIFDEYKLVPYAGLVISAGVSSLINGLVVTVSYGSATELDIGSGILFTGNQDDILNKTYIEIKQCF